MSKQSEADASVLAKPSGKLADDVKSRDNNNKAAATPSKKQQSGDSAKAAQPVS